jgi:hypothetical protein
MGATCQPSDDQIDTHSKETAEEGLEDSHMGDGYSFLKLGQMRGTCSHCRSAHQALPPSDELHWRYEDLTAKHAFHTQKAMDVLSDIRLAKRKLDIACDRWSKCASSMSAAIVAPIDTEPSRASVVPMHSMPVGLQAQAQPQALCATVAMAPPPKGPLARPIESRQPGLAETSGPQPQRPRAERTYLPSRAGK